MNKNSSNYFKEHKSIVIVSLTLFFLLSFSLFFIAYNSKENKLSRYLNNLSKDLNEINLTLSSGIKDSTIDTTITRNILSSALENLTNVLASISEVEEISEDISLTKSNLTTAINSTIALYDNNLSILSNPETIKTIDDLDRFNSLKEACIINYSELENNNININFSDETLTYFNNFINYMNTIIKINRNADFKNTQITNYIYTLEGYKDDISYLNEDLFIAIDKIREDKRDLHVIIDDIYKKEETYNNLKENVAFISIPEGCMEIYEALNEYLNTYSAYLKSIKEAVIYEKTATDIDKSSDEISKNYKNSTSKRNDSLTAYNNYENKLKKF